MKTRTAIVLEGGDRSLKYLQWLLEVFIMISEVKKMFMHILFRKVLEFIAEVDL